MDVNHARGVGEDSRRVFCAIARGGVLFPSVFDEVAGKPENNFGAVGKFGRGLGHLLTAGGALCRFGRQIMAVADGEFGNHWASIQSLAQCECGKQRDGCLEQIQSVEDVG